MLALAMPCLAAPTPVTNVQSLARFGLITSMSSTDLVAVEINLRPRGIALSDFAGQAPFTATSNGLFNLITLTSNGLVTYVTVTSNDLFNSLLNVSNFLATSSIDVKTNDSMMVLQAAPIRGSQWYVGTNGTPNTNGERSGFEFHAGLRALRMGYSGSVQWNDTNTGHGSVNFGFSNIAGGRFTSIVGGRNNKTHTNVENAFIGGGMNHSVSTNSTNIVIGGGENNSIELNCAQSTIGGGQSHIVRNGATFATISGGSANIVTDPYNTIGGGLNNLISDSSGSSVNSSASTISGGELNIVRGLRANIAGGYQNVLLSDSDYTAISGGSSNSAGVNGGPGNGTQFSVMGGGSQNFIGASGLYSTIGGGQLNFVGANSIGAIIPGGVSNNIGVNAIYAGIWGNWGTNSSAHTGLASYEKVTVRGRTNATLVAGSYATPTNRVAGAGTGSTNYTLLATTGKMYLGSSNVNIVAVMNYEAGVVMPWTVYITNLSADTWGFSFSAATNRVRWQSWMYGTNAPVLLTNNTLLRLHGESEGTNTLVTYEYFSPAL